jgi:hypothetical protein
MYFKGLFRLRISSPLLATFEAKNLLSGLMDILSEDDAQSASSSVDNLSKIFEDLDSASLREFLLQHPILLLLNPFQLQNAVRTIIQQQPGINPSYLVSQQAAGVEVILRAISENEGASTDSTSLQTIIAPTDVPTFLQRVPHALIPKYLHRLHLQVEHLIEQMGFTREEALQFIMRWPAVLYCDLDKALKRCCRAFKSYNLDIPLQALAFMLKKEPSLLAMDTFQRLASLRQHFPMWQLNSVLVKYPRLLAVRNLHSITNKYKVCSI